jgi:hypothetical protein
MTSPTQLDSPTGEIRLTESGGGSRWPSRLAQVERVAKTSNPNNPAGYHCFRHGPNNRFRGIYLSG